MRGSLLAIALVLAVPALAQAQENPCTGDFSSDVKQVPGAKRLRFGIYPGGSAGQVGPVSAASVPENAAKREAALAQLRPTARPGEQRDFVVHLYRHFTADSAMREEEPQIDADVYRYTQLGYQVELVVRYMPADEDPAKHVPQYVEFLRGIVRRYGVFSHFVSIQVTNEVNFPYSKDSSDGAFEGAKDALIQGIEAVKSEARGLGYSQIEAGFNWLYRMPDQVERPFWEYLRDHGGPRFLAALGWVGVDLYPGTFFPMGDVPTKRESVLNAFDVLRDCFFEIPKIPDSIPLHVSENGYPTGPGRSPEAQRQALEEMVHAVDDARGAYNVTDHRWFDLRDADSSSPSFQQQYGLMTDDYTPKPAFDAYDKLVEQLARTVPVLRLSVRPRTVRRGHRTKFRFTVTPRTRGVTIRFAGKRARTGRRGRARIVSRFAKRGRRRASARLPGWRSGHATVRVR